MMRVAAFIVLCVAAAQAQGPSLRDRMLAAEDGRAPTAQAMAPLLQGLRARDSKLVVVAVRALGRLERPDLVPQLLAFASHSRPDVRAEAANALGQALAGIPRGLDDPAPLPAEVALVTKALQARLRAEPDPYVTGVVAETLGRLPFRTAEAVTAVEQALASLLPAPEAGAPIPFDAARGTPPPAPVRPSDEPLARVLHPGAVAGAVKGLETRIRVYQKLAPLQPATIARLRSAATLGSDPSDADLAFIRRVAWNALNAARGADAALVDRGFEDPDPQVRRFAVLALGNLEIASAQRAPRLLRALADASFIVRYDAVRVFSRTQQRTGCAPLLAAMDDANVHVALAAIDAVGEGCPAGPSPVARLIQLAESSGGWHRPAHALVSLARVAPDHAASRMPAFAEHPIWQVRMYAARAAAAMTGEARLERLAADPHDNVREAAIAGLAAIRGHRADDIYFTALERPDYQLLITAANALKGSTNRARAVPALLAALTRVTAEQRDTSRDTRLAILERLQELGGRQHAAALQPCLADFDPAVARRCASVLSAWTGTPYTAAPRARNAAGAPASVDGRNQARAHIAMRRGGSFELRLFGEEAPATVARFVRLARQGYYNGLTFHRVVPNFVLQGGSPGANEYMGDGPFMRDELGLRTHARGTLGISTRGRDTGDAQIFINLLDNPRLDHNYTVFAEIAAGMDVVDAIVEGDVIERIELGTSSSDFRVGRVLEPPAARSRR